MNAAIRRLILDPASKLFAPFYSGLGTIIYLDQILPACSHSKMASNRSIEITPEFLEEILQFFIEKKYRALSLNELHDVLLGRLKLNEKFVCYTFDDGYLSNYITALSVFRKYEIPFAINVCSSFVEGDGFLWWYSLEDLLMKNENVVFRDAAGENQLACNAQTDKESAFDRLTHHIRTLGVADRDRFIVELCESHGIAPCDRARRECLNWEQVRELSRDPLVTIGAHTVNHHNFTCLSDDEILKEASSSRKIIEDRIDLPVNHFAYPFGNTNAVGAREGKAAAGAGFKTMTTTRKANIFRGHRDHLDALPRIMPSGNYATLSRLERFRTGAIPALNYKFRRVVTYD